jgi:hypothetical protein
MAKSQRPVEMDKLSSSEMKLILKSKNPQGQWEQTLLHLPLMFVYRLPATAWTQWFPMTHYSNAYEF